MNKTLNLLIVDDHPMIIEAYASIISTNLKNYFINFHKATNCEIAYRGVL
jgi:DNA-binding NarL/FixJ family response regulator